MSYSTVDKSTIDLLIRIGVDVTCQDEVTCFLYIKEYL